MNCQICKNGNEATCFDVATGLAVCINHVTPNQIHFAISPIPGGGFGIWKKNSHINSLEANLVKIENAIAYAQARMLEERGDHLK
jgi:hypothetical protein